ncbi:hypothetical protein Tsubulata_000801 [Turnera subulata]|uniref:Uncharacterized protein n=1 Tax=Turnera subulata TaxID=218843 RepID=A0A9Q0JKI0_9ROSI|nr:hypothetical protein Tsubulata_000801 [Turnera subulata]
MVYGVELTKAASSLYRFMLWKQFLKANQYPNTSLLQIEGVNTKEEVNWYVRKCLAYVFKASMKRNGTHYRCIWGKVSRPHGNSGVVPAKVLESGCSCTQATYKVCSRCYLSCCFYVVLEPGLCCIKLCFF